MIAIILTIIFPGLGQIYYGKTTKGIIMIILTFVPFLYPFILIWSIIDCIKLRKEQQVEPITRKEAITAIIIFFICVSKIIYQARLVGSSSQAPSHAATSALTSSVSLTTSINPGASITLATSINPAASITLATSAKTSSVVYITLLVVPCFLFGGKYIRNIPVMVRHLCVHLCLKFRRPCSIIR